MTPSDRLDEHIHLIALESIDSTNDEAKRQANAGAADGTMIWAREQLAGRGRHGRVWSSPPGNLYLSLVLRPNVAPVEAMQLGFVAAVALSDTLTELLQPGVVIGHKWPNDVLVSGAKIAGILAESAATAGQSVAWAIMGVGVNVAHYPAQTDYGATSLRQAGSDITVEAMLPMLANRMLNWRDRWQASGFAPVKQAWLARAIGLGAPLAVKIAEATIEGCFNGVDDGGALVLRTGDGRLRAIAAGDVQSARAA